ncbi:hypothetical protein [Tautonia plasticadhaerens]|uniref:Uncharacterized protein n=1 Tax=Tautonia plasticadhaerens TaxID=2527974 RepID=A0A518H351_9BACT|nr:hypothetical protein [Tautonia plasticadhaerens]QDV35274.1 hypothetical protein ElP_31770 [Tautonia plasticadhaerens]
MSDDIEVHFDPRRRLLSLACGEEAFSRLRDRIFEEATIPDLIGPPSPDVHRIEIESVPAAEGPRRHHGRWPASLAAGLAGLAGLFVFGVGLWTILR